MNAIYLLILAVLAALCFFFARRKKDNGGDICEITTSNVERVIRVYDMDEATLNTVIDEFIKIYSDNDDIERPCITKEEENYRLTFTPALNYISICYWVNYLVFSDENKQHRHTVRGWYTFGEVILKGERLPFCNQTVMLYVDKDDKECDNVSLVTPDGNHYLQPFAIADNLQPAPNSKETYHPL